MNDTEELIGETVVKAVLEYTTETLKDLSTEWSSKLKSKFRRSFKSYTEETTKQCSEVRNLINKNNPSKLSDIYVEPPFFFFRKKYQSFNNIDIFENHNKILIKGTAGLGKSTLCKHLYLKFLKNIKNGIPLFFEFKYINNTDYSIWEFILNELKLSGVEILNKHIIELFKSGKFVLIFDGLDEVDPDRRFKIERQLRELLKECRSLRIIISSRPDERLEFWDNFRIIRLLPFSKDKSIELIQKIEFDNDIKQQFISHINDSIIYKKFESFLSNPLLTTIMFITYDEFGLNALSNKVKIFYEHALEALLVRHDSTKSHLHRKFESGLNPYDLKSISEVFAILSYTDRSFSFTKSQTIIYINNAKEISGLKFNSEKLLADLIRSICLIHQDGLNFTFTHRSFQEYLSAVFLSKLEHPKRRVLLNNILKNIETDNVIPLLYSINSQLVLVELAIPLLKEAISKCKELESKGKSAEALIEFYAEFKISKTDNYKLLFRNQNIIVKLLKVISEHSEYVKAQYKNLPKTIPLNGKELSLNQIMYIPSKNDRKTFNLELLSYVDESGIKLLKLNQSVKEVIRLYQNCLFEFEKEVKNTSKTILNYLVNK